MRTEASIIQLSGDDIIELIKEHRNELIDKLMDTSELKNYLEVNYQLQNPSIIKIEFIKRSLKDLANSKLDLPHYSSLILELKKTDMMPLSKSKLTQFDKDIFRAIKSYL